MKIIGRITKAQEEGRPLFSFEYFSPKTAQVTYSLLPIATLFPFRDERSDMIEKL
jgi:hypothetical protein